jgi:hypothetical protein
MKTSKFLALLLCVILLNSCTSRNIDKRGQNSSDYTESSVKHKYKIGDIVYLKPDSVKAVVEELTDSNTGVLFSDKKGDELRPTYSVSNFRPDGMKNIERGLDEALIY